MATVSGWIMEAFQRPWRPMAGRGVLALAVMAAILSTGCGQPADVQPPRQAGVDTMSVGDLAVRLNLRLTESNACLAVMRDACNTVTLYPEPNGQAFVNGQPVGLAGGIWSADGAIYVLARLEPHIRLALRSPQSPPPVRPPFQGSGGTGSHKTQTNPPPAAGGRVRGRVMIDAGHGGKDPGAISVLGTHEKAITLSVAMSVAGRLRKAGVDVLLSRSGDTYISPDDRAALANRSKLDLFVSIHADSLPSKPQEYGFAVWLSKSASSQSISAAKAIGRRLSAMGALDRGLRRNDFIVLVNTTCPAVLVEMGFLSNRAEAARLASASEQSRYAQAIADGVIDYLRTR